MGATALTLTPPDGAWMKEAACAGRWEVMQSTDESDVKAAKALCAACPVEETCQAWLLALPPRQDVTGTAGGMTAEERVRARRRIRRAQPRPQPRDEPPKTCKSCEETHAATDFYARPTSRGGREAVCRFCRLAQKRAWRDAQRAKEAACRS